ncbi:Arc family DNA-binding protein [Citrobacter freundii]|uniref:Arc family DNA-binding protein n=1 Tax=Citrobacter freundii TaxID=546 RepID=UPI003A863A99
MQTHDFPKLNIRASVELKQQLTDLAAKNHRSMNSEIVLRLMESIEREAQKGEAQAAGTV